jgi:MEDS: MEthanogen/methylotroph, DcmR Sensory domain
MKTKMNELLQNNESAHLLYAFNGMENYINNAVSYILDGVAKDQSIILIDNERYLPYIMKELKKHLNENEMAKIHQINNFDFYFSSGSYHPPAIVNYIEKMYKPFLDEKITFRTWTHVEWGTIDGPLSIVEELEKVVDRLVADMGLVVMCAYEEEGMPESLKLSLLRTHKFILTDDDVVFSDLYDVEDLIK